MSSLLFTVCIPAYNRARHLAQLLDSILAQDFSDFEVLICEDRSPERAAIEEIAETYIRKHPGKLRYVENATNLGYDGNIRQLAALARGDYCFYMGNDDVMCPGALKRVARCIQENPGVGIVLRSYGWFSGHPDATKDVVKYVESEVHLQPGLPALSMCYRRSGVISGYIVHAASARHAANDMFDGTLYYQMHLTAATLKQRPAVAIPDVLVLCRADEAPDFGSAASEKGKFLPGSYTPAARLAMLTGALGILDFHFKESYPEITFTVRKDYAAHFYAFSRDQLSLPWREYIRFCASCGQTGLGRYPAFYLNCLIPFLLGRERFDAVVRFARARIGRTPRLA